MATTVSVGLTKTPTGEDGAASDVEVGGVVYPTLRVDDAGLGIGGEPGHPAEGVHLVVEVDAVVNVRALLGLVDQLSSSRVSVSTYVPATSRMP